MQYDDIRTTLLQILSFPKNKDKYLTIDQICSGIKSHFPSVWQEINSSFPNITEYPQILNQYTPSNFVANALKYYSSNNGIPGLEQDELDIANINNTDKITNTITVWRVRNI
ncbi:MAG: hypothetical protein IKP71_08120 [Candidatus Riflebacteria bacterium]|nr:hypothetical protein [Candidatus Riflebacteria bacterium]